MNIFKKRVFDLLAVGVILFSLPSMEVKRKENKPARKVILMIGDGMGIAQAYAAWTVNHGFLNMFSCPFTGLCLTSSAGDYITDSAAGATAFATGEKTKNGYLSMDTAGHPLTTIVEIAEQRRLATGLVATSALTHATPAAFVSHQMGRNDYENIAADFLKTDVDVLIGGGADHFRKRKDGKDLTAELARKGYALAFSIEEADKVTAGKLAAFTAAEHTPKFSEGRGNMLPRAVEIALRLLSQDKNGFFLMVEGSQIDWGNHANDADYVINETMDFDRAVGVALDFARKDGNTLLVILADHESGGLTITGGNVKNAEVKTHFSTHDHTPVPVPVYAYGPGAEKFTGVYENTEVFRKIKSFLGI